MQWDSDAARACDNLPVPPMLLPYTRIHAEKIARQQGLACVSAAQVAETARVYATFMGSEKTEEFRRFLDGTGPAPAVEDELFFDDERALYYIDVCFAKYGENSRIVRDALKEMKRAITAVMEQEHLSELMADRAPGVLHGASRFTVGMTGCPNCCVSPWLRDFGITMQHYVAVTDASCTGCGACVGMCLQQAVSLTDAGPVIDRERCIHCELCARDCPTGRLSVSRRGWRVIAGGAGGPRPALAVVIEEFAPPERVLELLRNAIARLQAALPGDSLKKIIAREGPGALG